MVDVVDGTADGEGDRSRGRPSAGARRGPGAAARRRRGEHPGRQRPQAPDVREDAADVTMVLRDLFLARPGMDREDRRLATRLLARPTVPGTDTWASYDPEQPTAQRCNARICVTYVTGGNDRATPAWADQTLAAVDEAWTGQVDQMGYPAPASDGTAGGDARFDVYLANISDQGLYGYCVPDGRVPGQPGKSSSYCVLDNDMVGFSDTPSASLHVTAVHEFFHAVQFNVDVREDRWWMEATATWMEEVLADSVNDNRQFLSAGQLGRPGRLARQLLRRPGHVRQLDLRPATRPVARAGLDQADLDPPGLRGSRRVLGPGDPSLPGQPEPELGEVLRPVRGVQPLARGGTTTRAAPIARPRWAASCGSSRIVPPGRSRSGSPTWPRTPSSSAPVKDSQPPRPAPPPGRGGQGARRRPGRPGAGAQDGRRPEALRRPARPLGAGARARSASSAAGSARSWWCSPTPPPATAGAVARAPGPAAARPSTTTSGSP